MPIRRVDATPPRRRTPARGAARPATATRPDLRVVPRRRAAVNAVLVLVVVIVALMLAAVMLHTRLTERQLEIDRLEQQVTEARERFDMLRQQRAELRSPTRLALESADLGMVTVPGTEFVAIDGRTLAEVIAAAGTIDELADAVDPADPLDQIRRVKRAAVEAGE